jgi:antitoxin component YwqK of YwqJK toxin-antitoxin module
MQTTLKTEYYDNGQKKSEENYKDGKLVKETYWYENGQKKYEINYKDGERDGLRTSDFGLLGMETDRRSLNITTRMES